MYKKGIIVVCLLFSGLLLSGCSLKSKPAALQINTTPSANVFVDGKLLGKTPYSSSELKAGEVTIKLIPESTTEVFTSWEGKIKLIGGILTLIDREFAASETNASGQILSLEKIKDKNAALISIVTEPDGVLVKIDGETKGFSPLNVESIPVGDHEIVLSKDGYNDKSLRVKNVLAYRLIVNAKLGQGSLVSSPTPTPTPTLSGPTPKVSGKATTSPTPTKTAGTNVGNSAILVKENSLGFLRVRNAPSGTEIGQIKPIDPERKYPLLEEKTGWYKIAYEEGKEGWVTADTTYTTKISE